MHDTVRTVMITHFRLLIASLFVPRSSCLVALAPSGPWTKFGVQLSVSTRTTSPEHRFWNDQTVPKLYWGTLLTSQRRYHGDVNPLYITGMARRVTSSGGDDDGVARSESGDSTSDRSADDAGHGDGSQLRQVNKIEYRDFRARLIKKGLDGWGVDTEGDEHATQSRAVSVDRWAHKLVQPELGCLIIAREDMFTQSQQYFHRAVMVITQHDQDGTVGLILNRPTIFTVGEVRQGNLRNLPGMEDNVLYMGGDVAGAREDGLDVVNLMHGRQDIPAIEVVKGLRLGGLEEALALIAEGKADPEEFKLEAEVLNGDWILAACDIKSVLRNHNHPDQPGHFWNEIMARL